MQAEILAAKNTLDSVGGVIECAVLGVPAGVGSPDFGYNMEGVFAQYMFGRAGSQRDCLLARDLVLRG